MTDTSKRNEDIARETHVKWLENAHHSNINGMDLLVLPYGFLSQAVIEALQAKDAQRDEAVREARYEGAHEATMVCNEKTLPLAVREAVKQERERIVRTLKGLLIGTIDFSMYKAIHRKFDVDDREAWAKEKTDAIITLLTTPQEAPQEGLETKN